jgi:hypothetical protein
MYTPSMIIVCQCATVFAKLPPYGYYSVLDFGARADGSDDTTAFDKALQAAAAAAAGRRYSHHPRHLERALQRCVTRVERISLSKLGFTGRTAPVGTTLLAYAGQGNQTSAPFIMLHTNSGVRGFNVFYPAQN